MCWYSPNLLTVALPLKTVKLTSEKVLVVEVEELRILVGQQKDVYVDPGTTFMQ